MVDWKQYVSVAALVVSVTSFGLTYRLSTQTATTSVQPVLVFEYSGDIGWSVRNVGNGPALNVLLAWISTHRSSANTLADFSAFGLR